MINKNECEWFVESASPWPNIRARYAAADGELIVSEFTVLAVERLYPVDRDGHRRPGSEWLDSRITVLDGGSDGLFDRATDAGNFHSICSANEPPSSAGGAS